MESNPRPCRRIARKLSVVSHAATQTYFESISQIIKNVNLQYKKTFRFKNVLLTLKQGE